MSASAWRRARLALIFAATSVLPAVAADAFPVTVANCGVEVTLTAAPERLMVVNSDDLSLLSALDALPLVVARTTAPQDGLYDAATKAAIEAIPQIATETGATGGAVIALEKILELAPNLLLSPESAADRQQLAAAGIALYSPPAYCTDTANIPGGTASFERVYEQLATFGQLLGRSELAAQRVAELKAEVAALAAQPTQGTGVAIYVAGGGKTLYPYGARSMVTPVFAAAGLENVYADRDERVFEASVEDLLGKDPGTIVLLYDGVPPEEVVAAFMTAAGVDSLSAVKAGRIVPLQFSFTDPPSPLSIKGATELATRLKALQ